MDRVDTTFAARFFTVATAGHVDHGKTSLLKTLTGIDPDRLKEEKERQMTTDLGFAHLKLESGHIVGFIDVPGHGKFLKNMLAGVGGIDMALLVVAADEGPMPQTRQHVKILGLLGTQRVLIAVTKIDAVEPSRLSPVKAQVEELLKQYDLEPIGCAFVSNTKRQGFDELRATLVQCLDKLPQRQPGGGAFLPVDRVFSKTGFGTVVTGTLVRGNLSVGDQIWLNPGSARARVRRLETFGQVLNTAGAGQRLACNLALKDNTTLARGSVIASTDLPAASSLIASLSGWADDLGPGKLEGLTGQDVRLYHGTAEYHGRISWVEALKESPKSAVAQITLSQPAVAEPGERFVLRLSDDAICGGAILVINKPRWLTRSKVCELSGLLMSCNYEQAALFYLRNSPQRATRIEQLFKLIPAPECESAVASLVASGQLVDLSGWLLIQVRIEEIRQKILDALEERKALHGNTYEGAALSVEHLRARILPGLERSVFHSLIDEMIGKAEISREGDKLLLPGDATTSGAGPDELKLAVLKELEENVCVEIAELARNSGSSVDKVKLVLRSLAQEKRADIVNYDFAAGTAQIERAHQILSDLWTEKRQISPSDFRERLGTSRKFVMPLLSYFDDHSITRRMGTGRVLLKQPEAPKNQ